MSALLWTLLGIVLVLLIIWLILRWRRLATGTRTVPAGAGRESSLPRPTAPRAEKDPLPAQLVSRTGQPAPVGTGHTDGQLLVATQPAPAGGAESGIAGAEPMAAGAERSVVGPEPIVAFVEPSIAVAEPIVATAEPIVAGAEPIVAVAEPIVAGAEPGTVPAPPVLDLKAARPVLGRTVRLDDLTVVEGIGPKISELLHGAGIRTWQALSQTPVPTLAGILVAAGPRFGMHDPGTWPRQAGLLANGQWDQFKQWTSGLDGGRERT